MEVHAAASVVMQKLMDMLNENSVANNKVMIHQLKGIQKCLRKIKSFSAEGESDASHKAREYLRVLYDMEDEIEKFTFRISRQRKKFGFLMKRALFFNNLHSCRKLRCKMKKIQCRFQRINQNDPSADDVGTPFSTTTLSVCSSFSHEQPLLNTIGSISDASFANFIEIEAAEEKDDNGVGVDADADADDYDDDDIDNEEPSEDAEVIANTRTKQSRSAIWPIAETQTASPRKRILSRSLNAIPLPAEHQEEELVVFGFQDDVNNLVKRLTGKGELFIPIVGKVASGKTTLVRAIYRNKKLKRRFEFHAWVSVSKEHDLRDILASLLKSFGCLEKEADTCADVQALKTRLFEHLMHRRYTIVLDGVGSSSMLEDLKDAFPDNKVGSKVILTSSEDWVRSEMSPHHLNPLAEEDSWNMFLKKVGREKAGAQVPETLKHRILDICKGLPLKIILIAGLLSSKKTKEWSTVLSLGGRSDDALFLCYNDLSAHAKICLLYLVLFPKEYDIPVRRLLRLWLAEGFVKRRSPEYLSEELVQKCFEDLVGRSMIQVTKLRSDNSPRGCRLPGVLYDYLLPKAQEISLFYMHRNLADNDDAEGQFGVRRMVLHAGGEGLFPKTRRENKQSGTTKTEIVAPISLLSTLSSCFSSGKQSEYERIQNFTMPSLFEDIQRTESKHVAINPSVLRSVLSFNSQKKDMPAKEIGTFLGTIIQCRFRLLRVLDLEGVYKPSLPQNLGALYQLRYLGLRRTFLDSLPKSVGDLPYLETLDVKHTGIDSLPDSIWELKQLRHLNLNNIRLRKPPRSSLTLLTLWGLFIDENISVKDGLGKLLGLRELGISFHLSSGQELLIDWIAKLTELQSLRLHSLDDMWNPSKLILKPLLTLGKLSHLNLLGNLERLPDSDEFPPTLKVLTLSISKLKNDPMQTLGQLPCLTVLRLLADSYVGKKLVCSHGGFSKLRVLKLWFLKELEDWEVEEESMGSLKELDIRCCHKLNSIPTSLLQQRYLEEVILTNMTDEFVADIKGRKSDDTSLTINHLEFRP